MSVLELLEIHFWEVPCSARQVHRAPKNVLKHASVWEFMHPEKWARIALTFSHRTPETESRRRDKNANLSSKKKSPEYDETQMLKHMNFPHCIPAMFGLEICLLSKIGGGPKSKAFDLLSAILSLLPFARAQVKVI